MLYSSPVLTPFGFKPLKDIQVGDAVCNPDGSTAAVIQVHETRKQTCYRVGFVDGASVVVGEDHLWSVKVSGKRTRNKVPDPYKDRPDATAQERFNMELCRRYKTVTTEKLAELHSRAEADAARGTRPRWVSIPLTEPVNSQSPPGRTTMMPGYILGVWLGDGSMPSNTPSWSKPDVFIADEVRRELKAAGWKTETVTAYKNGKSFGFCGGGVAAALCSVSLDGCRSWEKFIPEQYKNGPLDLRWSVANGLMDTDGYIDERGQCYYTSTSHRLALDFQYLVRSLGFTATIFDKPEPTYVYDGEVKIGRPAWNVYITGRGRENLFRLPRKKARSKDINTEGGRRVVSVEKLPKKLETRCITVSHPNGLFITNDFIVTHNSDALLMSALQYVDVPGFSGILFRRTLSELKLPGSLLDRAHSWLYNKPCKFIAGEHTYLFPTQYPNGTPGEPAKLVFGYLGLESAKARYQSAEFHFVGFDEVTHHAESDYLWMFSRIRKVTCSVHKTDPTGKPIYVPGCVECGIKSTTPERMRSASNPGNVGHQWVQARFKIEPVIDPVTNTARWVGKNPSAPFIPSLFKDNPYLDQISYRENLDQLDPLTRAQLQDGNWGASAEARFKANWFRRYSLRGDYYHLGRAGSGPAYFKTDFLRIFVTVDPAASASEGPGDLVNYNRLMQKSHTVIAVWGLTPEYHLLWLDNLRIYVESPDIIRALKGVYRQWKFSHAVIEATGLGKAVYQAAVRSGLPVRPVYPHTDKVMRATDAMIRAEQGRIWLPEHPGPGWLKPLEDELLTWTGHPQQSDDQIDALSHAANDVSWEAAHSDRANDPDLPQDEVIDANSPYVHGGSGFGGIGGFNRVHDPYEHV